MNFIMKTFSALALASSLFSLPHPIQFSIPECKIVKEIPQKDKDFATIIPGDRSTYIFKTEEDYYRDYQRSYFAITTKKAGWDCLRHYEILASGCIPYFLDLDHCDERTMPFLPKKLIQEAMKLPGVSYLNIDHKKFNKEKYNQILAQLLEHTKKHLTTRQMAKYLIDKIKYQGDGKILFISYDIFTDYLRCLSLIGLKELFCDRVVDVPKISHIYTNYPLNVNDLYGMGMSYTKIIEDQDIDRTHIAERIKNHEFDLIIYGSFHRGLPYINLVQQNYPPEKIAYLCGEDLIEPWQEVHKCPYSYWPNFFLREQGCLNK